MGRTWPMQATRETKGVSPYIPVISLLILLCDMTERDCEVIENTRSRVKIKSKLTNFMKLIRIEGYNGKDGSDPQGNREILDDLFKFDEIGQ